MGEVSRIWMCVKSMVVASGCGCKEVYRFPHITYPYSSCICSFRSSITTFCLFFYVFLIIMIERIGIHSHRGYSH